LDPEHQDLQAALRRVLLPDDEDGAESPAALPQVGFGAQALEVTTLRAGDRVGPYQLVRELGSGGMAEVWLAQRADGAFKRELALKPRRRKSLGGCAGTSMRSCSRRWRARRSEDTCRHPPSRMTCADT
jgi:hypothetical protein